MITAIDRREDWAPYADGLPGLAQSHVASSRSLGVIESDAPAEWSQGAPAVPVRPPFPYAGGKQRIAGRIAALLPAHRHYVEPFAGGLSVLAAKMPSRHETVNDLDGDLVAFWRVLRDRPFDLIRACALTPHARAEQAAARNLDGVDEVERARRVWVALSQSRGASMLGTGWRTYISPRGASIGLPGYLDGYVDRMAAMAQRLHHVSLECRPALEVIDIYGRASDVLLYVDPPYLGSTRSPSRLYRHEMRAEAEHRALAAALHRVNAAVVVSGYPSALYDELFADWYTATLRANVTQHNAGTDRMRTEVVWSNRPLTVEPTLDWGAA